MKAFIQNHPGERDAKPGSSLHSNNRLAVFFMGLLMVGVPIIITAAVSQRLKSIGKVMGWEMYLAMAVLFLVCLGIMMSPMRKLTLKSKEQKKYYQLAGRLSWLPQPKREALQLEAQYAYYSGYWVETLEYWPCEVRLKGKPRFTTFELTTREERLAANDEAWNVLSEKSYAERIEALFTGMHSRLFASHKQTMAPQNRTAMVSRLSELTQLPENYINSCWEPQGTKPALLIWAFDLHRVVELSRTSFMAGLIGEERAWEQILKASEYAHALFDNPDDFFNNYRIGHAYWSNDFKQTSEVAQAHKIYNSECKWPIKDVAWTKKDYAVLPETIRNGCSDYVAEELKKNVRNTIGFQTGNSENRNGEGAAPDALLPG